MSKKNVVIYNKSPRKFVLPGDITIKGKSHCEVPSDLAKDLLTKYKGELTDVKVEASTGVSDAERVKFEAEKAEFAAKVKAFEAEVEEFTKAKEAK